MKYLGSVFIAAALNFSCTPHEGRQPDRPVVTVSIAPEAYIIAHIAGDLVTVNVMVPSGSSPATYEPNGLQMKQLDRSDLYMGIGNLGFELEWMDKIGAMVPGLKIEYLSEGINLIEADTSTERKHYPERLHRDKGINPHIWMSVRNVSLMADHVFESLKGILPGEEATLSRNLEKFQTGLDSLDSQIKTILHGYRNRAFLIYHPSLAYFARDYGLVEIPLEREGKEPSPAIMKSLSDKGRELGISTIFIQRQFDRKNADALARELNAKVIVIDPLDADWENQMLHVAKSLENSWKNKTP